MRFVHFKYAAYIFRHKWFVFKECRRLGVTWLGIIHDLSKFSPDEWVPYARYFYGKYQKVNEIVPAEFRFSVLSQEDVDHDFDVAWLKHIHRNKHHPQYWVLREDSGKVKVLDMPECYLYEMLADWIGAGKAQGNPDDVEVWYMKNREHILLSDFGRTWIEQELGLMQ